MQQLLYLCDNCKKKLTQSKKDINHLSIKFNIYSGWVCSPLWKHQIPTSVSGIKQFCNGKCLGDYFDKILKQYAKVNS